MCRPAFAVRSGHAMAAAVDSRDQPDDAVKQGCSSFITSFRSLEAVRQPLTISSYVVPPTIGTKRSNVSVCLFGKVRRSIRLSPNQHPNIDSTMTRYGRHPRLRDANDPADLSGGGVHCQSFVCLVDALENPHDGHCAEASRAFIPPG